jgi:hypothetical protein
MNNKSFDLWNTQKKNINNQIKNPFFHEREVWFIKIGENIGYEENGKGDKFLRPILIYKKFSKNTFLGIPLTSKKKNNKFHISFVLKNKLSCAILSQIRLFDAKRLDYLYGKIQNQEFYFIKEKLIELIQ